MTTKTMTAPIGATPTFSLNHLSSHATLTWMLRFFVSALFLGRAWQFLRWDAPLRTLFWKQAWMETPVLWLTGMSWEQYVTSPTTDWLLQAATRGMGVIMLVCGILCWTISGKKRWHGFAMMLGALVLAFTFALYFLGKSYQIGMGIEHALQGAAPLFLAAWLARDGFSKRALNALYLATALTFIGHGLYAFGFHPQPGNFVSMTMRCLPLTESGARTLLIGAGILDFVAAAALLVPRLRGIALGYMVLWGFLTALARAVAYFQFDALLPWLDGWLHQTVYRLVHGGLPLVALLLWLRERRDA
ncbi:hypothetical protein [Acanthopleuribacter pedis]|uniref:Uncharacterized protein n=1 Tax=Acanthopleuribacter pedis TaxID=442870 RepID=A0A8J7QAU6_9BACT|nr:hypothetical protein [Acanthopleuribacter pedis]MBO1322081.1 hypothetical protein [Acanthopleuribacter pedis]